jgi:hypothetical protein
VTNFTYFPFSAGARTPINTSERRNILGFDFNFTQYEIFGKILLLEQLLNQFTNVIFLYTLLTGIASRKAAVLCFMCARYLVPFSTRRPEIVTINFRGFPQYLQENIPPLLDSRYHHLLKCALTQLLIVALSAFEIDTRLVTE